MTNWMTGSSYRSSPIVVTKNRFPSDLIPLEACLMKVTKLHLCGSIGRRPFILLMTVSDLKILFVGKGEEKQIRYERMNEMC